MRHPSMLIFAIFGGLLYQGGRFLLGLPPTWDTFYEVTMIFVALWAAANVLHRATR